VERIIDALLGWLFDLVPHTAVPAAVVLFLVGVFLLCTRRHGFWGFEGATGGTFIACVAWAGIVAIAYPYLPRARAWLVVASVRHQFFSDRTWFALDLKNPGTLDACDVVTRVWLLDERVVALDSDDLGSCVAAGGPGNTMMTSAQRRLDTRGIVYAVVCFDGGRLDGFWVYDPQIGPQMPLASPEEQEVFRKAAGPALASDSACDGGPLPSSPHSGQEPRNRAAEGSAAKA